MTFDGGGGAYHETTLGVLAIISSDKRIKFAVSNNNEWNTEKKKWNDDKFVGERYKLCVVREACCWEVTEEQREGNKKGNNTAALLL